MKCVTPGVCLAIVTLTLASATSQPSIPACKDKPDLSSRWQAAWNSLGVAPSQEPERLGDLAAVRWFGSRNWFPVDGRRQLLCGRLAEWSLYDGSLFSEFELDIHPNIVPGEGYEYVINDLPRSSFESVRVCANGQPCVYGEVTATPEITNWLLGSAKPKEIKGKYTDSPACIYGPWVMERVHGWLPEIHPVQQFWASVDKSSTEEIALVVLRDSSNRYGDPNRFKPFGSNAGTTWSPRSVKETIGFAFEIAAAGTATLKLTSDPKAMFGNVTSGDPNEYTRNFGGAKLDVSVPSWVRKGESETCVADDNGRSVVRGIEWLTVAFDPRLDAQPNQAAGAAMIARRTGMARPVPHEQLLRTAVAALARPAESDQPEPTMEVLDLRVLSEQAHDEPLPGTAGMWRLSDPNHDRWLLHGSQRLTTRVYYTGKSPTAKEGADRLNKLISKGTAPHVEVHWEFTPVVLDPQGSGPLQVGARETAVQYGVTAEAGSAITTRADGLRHPGRLTGSGEGQWRSLLSVTPPSRVFGPAPRLSPLLEVTATLKDTDNRTGTFKYRFHSYFPTFADTASNVDPPDSFLSALALIVKANRAPLQNVTVQEIVSRLTADWKRQDAPLADAAARRARIFRMAYLSAVRDGDIGPDDWLDLQRLATVYTEARWP